VAKKPVKKASESLVNRAMGAVKRNPFKSIAVAVTVLGALPTAVAGVEIFDPFTPALHYWVRDQLEPLLLVQNTQARSIDRFLLYQQTEALSKAKADPAARSSPVVQERIKDLQDQANETEERIKKSAAKK
jgi:ElaB/YqjD/DUF883 family membrane-anchored ribosome-binding protein